MVMDKVMKVEENWVRGQTIGRGSFGTVSLAVNKSGNRDFFAVKSVEKSASGNSTHQLEALENEIRILKSVSSPYVVKYLGDGVTVEATPAKTCFRNLYLEYLPGGTVGDLARERMKARVSADVDEKIIKNYTFCIVSALKYLHSKGIVHCDIKSDNVLVGPDSFTAKLADFGTAMEITPRVGGDDNKILTRGSPLWMAPEVVREEYQGPESDVWALGCTIIEMVTGKPAWEDKGPMETLCRIGYSDLLPELPTQLSELGRDFLEKCLRREPIKRWSCDQLLLHPFISVCSPINSASYSSPRCILDWFNLDSDHEDSDHEERNNTEDGICISRVKGRIGELASGTGANWESSDGWVEVRSSESLDSGCRWRSEEEGTSSAYSELSGVESEINGEDVDSVGIGEVSRSTNLEDFFLDSNRSLLQAPDQIGLHDDVVSSGHRQARNFLLLFYMLTNFDGQISKICSQYVILLKYIRIFRYIYISSKFFKFNKIAQ